MLSSSYNCTACSASLQYSNFGNILSGTLSYLFGDKLPLPVTQSYLQAWLTNLVKSKVSNYSTQISRVTLIFSVLYKVSQDFHSLSFDSNLLSHDWVAWRVVDVKHYGVRLRNKYIHASLVHGLNTLTETLEQLSTDLPQIKFI